MDEQTVQMAKLQDTLDKMSVTPNPIVRALTNAIDNIMDAITAYDMQVEQQITDLRAEGLSAAEETILARQMVRLRNVVIVERIDLL